MEYYVRCKGQIVGCKRWWVLSICLYLSPHIGQLWAVFDPELYQAEVKMNHEVTSSRLWQAIKMTNMEPIPAGRLWTLDGCSWLWLAAEWARIALKNLSCCVASSCVTAGPRPLIMISQTAISYGYTLRSCHICLCNTGTPWNGWRKTYWAKCFNHQ